MTAHPVRVIVLLAIGFGMLCYWLGWTRGRVNLMNTISAALPQVRDAIREYFE